MLASMAQLSRRQEALRATSREELLDAPRRKLLGEFLGASRNRDRCHAKPACTLGGNAAADVTGKRCLSGAGLLSAQEGQVICRTEAEKLAAQVQCEWWKPVG